MKHLLILLSILLLSSFLTSCEEKNGPGTETFEDGLEQTIQWFRDNWESINRDAEFSPGMSSAVKNYILQQEQA